MINAYGSNNKEGREREREGNGWLKKCEQIPVSRWVGTDSLAVWISRNGSRIPHLAFVVHDLGRHDSDSAAVLLVENRPAAVARVNRLGEWPGS